MCSLTITDAAYSRVKRELDRSPIEFPIVSLVQSSEAPLLPYRMLRPIDPGDPNNNRSDGPSARDAAGSSSLQPNLFAVVYSRNDVPIESRVEIRGIWFSFSPEWQQLMKGWLLDAVQDSLVLRDAAGTVVLPRA
jgi:hypothetical protein